jgi:nicotinamidase-related amidase
MPPPLEELVAPGRAGLILVEVQPGVVTPGGPLPQLADAAAEISMVSKLASLTRVARRAGVPVVHCTAASLPGGFGRNRNARLFGGTQRRGGLGDEASVRPVPEVYAEGDVVLPRYHGLGPFAGTSLDPLLRNEGISTVVVAGVSLNIALQDAVFDSVNLGYQAVILRDAVAGVPVEYGQQILDNTLSLLATLATCEQLEQAWKR